MIFCEGAKKILGDWLEELMHQRDPRMTVSNLAAAIEHFQKCHELECSAIRRRLKEILALTGKKPAFGEAREGER